MESPPRSKSSSLAVRQYPLRGFNRFGLPFLYGDIRRIPKVKADAATAQRYVRLSYNEAFQTAIIKVRAAGRIELKWFLPLFDDYRKLYNRLRRLNKKMSSEQSWEWTESKLSNGKLFRHQRPQNQQEYEAALHRVGIPQLELELNHCLERIKQQMEFKFPTARQLKLLRRFKLPEDSFWIELIEWLVHWGEVTLEEDNLWPTPHCSVGFIKRSGRSQLAIEVFKSTRPQDVKRLFEDDEIKFWKRFVKDWPKTFALNGGPECFLQGKGRDARGYIALGRRFNRDEILGAPVWRKVRQMQTRLPGEKAPKVHPTFTETRQLMVARSKTKMCFKKLPEQRYESDRPMKRVQCQLTYSEAMGKDTLPNDKAVVAARKRVERLLRGE